MKLIFFVWYNTRKEKAKKRELQMAQIIDTEVT